MDAPASFDVPDAGAASRATTALPCFGCGTAFGGTQLDEPACGCEAFGLSGAPGTEDVFGSGVFGGDQILSWPSADTPNAGTTGVSRLRTATELTRASRDRARSGGGPSLPVTRRKRTCLISTLTPRLN
ncbi:hypothetical protein AB0O91_31065 [Kitasatospora sp. NPDC089797]|uniref:hypothetical protein n=1 Tax=Kitasatospora sp. NPDC089797 TaxID=3155298 RepID=UPI0034148905